ncbi:MAG TPA: hypothetical protein VK919_02595 [Solirubrobacterales bacterium]|nr:hypothetical protein [Solirubrobacterales bacterium]
MAPAILAATDDGLREVPGGGAQLAGRRIVALAAGLRALFAIADGREVFVSDGSSVWRSLCSLADADGRCLLATPDGLLVGTEGAHLARASERGIEPVDGFESVAGRDRWFTPWGGPPATRSLSIGAEGELYANVHVGGIPRSDDGGASWRPTIEIEVDAHEVRSPLERPRLILAATAYGLATSSDGGGSWEVSDAGLEGRYSRAVALAGDIVLVTASDGPRGGHAAVYRRPLNASGPFERCRAGLPEWFDDNIDTGCLQAAGRLVAFGTAAGEVYASSDGGETWELASSGLPAVRSLLIVSGSRSG